MADSNITELVTLINGWQKVATIADLKRQLAEFDREADKAEYWRRVKANARNKLTKLRLLLALAVRSEHSGLQWPSEESRNKIISKSQALAQLTQDQLLAEAAVNLVTEFLDLVRDLPLS